MSMSRGGAVRLIALGLWPTWVSHHVFWALPHHSHPPALLAALTQPQMAAITGVLTALLILAFVCARVGKRTLRRARFIDRAAKLALDGGRNEGRSGRGVGRRRALVLVGVDGLGRLSAARRRGALKSLAAYLIGFIQSGEFAAPLQRGLFGLILKIEPDENFSHRLDVLAQDVGFIYRAAYPALRLGARIGACRMDDGGGAADAFACARCAYAAAHGAGWVLRELNTSKSAAAGPAAPRYQPVVSLGTSKVVTLEVMPPACHFGPRGKKPRFAAMRRRADAAQGLGLFDQVCRDLGALKSGAPAACVPLGSVARSKAIAALKSLALTNGLAPSRLIIQIPLLAARPGSLSAFSARLRRQGFGFALTEADPAALSPELVRSLAPCEIRVNVRALDRYVRRHGDRLAALIGSIVKAGARVIATGVETPSDEALVRRLGLRFAQGSLYAPAMPAGALKSHLAASPATEIQSV